MASPYRAFASASPSTFRNYDAPPVRRSPDPQFDDLLSDKELEASMDWPNWPNDPQGQMPLAQNNRQTIQAANQMRNIDLAGRRSQVRELLAEQARRRDAMKMGLAAGAGAGGAAASTGYGLVVPSTQLGKDDEVRPKSPTAPEYLMSSEPSWEPYDDGTPFANPAQKALGGQGYIDFVRTMENPLGLPPKSDARFHSPAWTAGEAGVRSRVYEEPAIGDPFGDVAEEPYEETAPEGPLSSYLWNHSPKFPGGNTPEERLSSTMKSFMPHYRTEPMRPQSTETYPEPLPLSKGGFPSGLLRHLLTPPPGSR